MALNFIAFLFHLVQFVKCWQIVLDLNSKRQYQSSEKDKESRFLVLTSSTKREIRAFRRSRAVTVKNVQKKRDARAELLFCQSIKTYCFFAGLVDVAVIGV